MGETIDRLAPDSRTLVERFVTDEMAENGLPGLSVAVVDGTELVYSDGFGSRDLNSNSPATGDTLFGIGSTTKSFTALGIMRLVEEDQLALDDPVADHLPVQFDYDVTIHHLLSHSAGTPSNGMANVLLSRLAEVGETGVPLADFDDFHAHVSGTLPEEVVADPGERFFYYATGFTLLGEIIERVTDCKYRTFMRERVLNPLDMNRSTFSPEVFESTPDRMTPYVKTENGFSARPYPFHDLTEATGGLMAPVTDLANYLVVQMNEGEFRGERLLDPSLARRMHTPHIDIDVNSQYGYGWMIREFLDDTLIGHSGDAVVGTAAVEFLRDANIGVAVASNVSPGFSLSYIAQGVLAILQDEDPRAVVPLFAHRDRLEALAGEYESYRRIKTVSVTREGGTLRVEIDGMIGHQEVMLVPAADDYRFELVREGGDRSVVEFVPTGDGFDMYYDRWVLHRV